MSDPRRWREGEPLAGLAAAAAGGAVIAIPTESSYGLGVDPRDAEAVARLVELKGRDGAKPFPVVAGDVEQLALLGVDPAAEALRRFAHLWPAPLSLLLPLALPRERPLPAALGEARVAVRVPAHEGLRRLLLALGRPLTATSANRAGEPPLLDADAVAELLADSEGAWIVDGGRLPGGPPSTLVAVEDGEVHVLRAGRFPAARLLAEAAG